MVPSTGVVAVKEVRVGQILGVFCPGSAASCRAERGAKTHPTPGSVHSLDPQTPLTGISGQLFEKE